MTITKEVLNDFKESYEKVRKLLDEDSKHDPPNEPYLSKYAARAILVHMRHSLKCLLEENPEDVTDLKSMLGAVLANIGIINMDTEETSEADKIFLETVELLEAYRLHPAFVISLITAYNHLGVLWSSRDDTENTKKYLLASKNLFHEFKQSEAVPISIDKLFKKEENENTGAESLEKAHTLTLYYLAQLFGALKENMKSAIYCHVTMKRQLEYADYEAIDWALNTATLSQFFAEQGGFVQARHHLAASSAVLHKHGIMLLAEELQSEAHDARVEVWKHRSADVARCWAKYCLMLLTASKSRLMAESEKQSKVTDLSNLKLEDDEDNLELSTSDLFFPNIDVSEFEEKVTASYLLTFEDACKVFLECQHWLNKAKEYYKLNTLASDYIEIVQDHSQAYSSLLFFEEDDDRQAKINKKRINMLEELLKEINPTYYLQYCRQLWYELGETYTDILNIKLDRLKHIKERPTPQMLNKINSLAESSISKFDLFLNSVKDTKTESLPVKLEHDFIRPVITALALVARNQMKIITPDKKMQIKHCICSLDAYNVVVEYCKRDEDAATMMSEEFSLCQEMVKILPLKIKKLEAASV